jgi:hypothetical protein
MGAALTYARRYALFTLVGIAGEDDLDAPDLNAPTAPASSAEKPAAKKLGRLNSGREHPAQRIPTDGGAKAASGPSKPILSPEASAALRDQLAVELKDLNSADEAANWRIGLSARKTAWPPPMPHALSRLFRRGYRFLPRQTNPRFRERRS